MWIGEPSPDRLNLFLAGYCSAMEQVGLKDIATPPFHGFHDWVAERFGFAESTAGWPNMILAVTLGLDPATVLWGYADGSKQFDAHATRQQKEDATRECFELLDEYRKGVAP